MSFDKPPENSKPIAKSFPYFSSRKIKEFTDFIWPIERHELLKFLSMTALMFCILFIQNMIRALKDSLVVTLIGAETITFLKFWGVLPAAILMSLMYVKLINSVKSEYIFYIVVSIFLIFFAAFAFYLLPNSENIHLSNAYSAYLVNKFPNFKWFILLLGSWSYSLFYIIAELWPNAVFSLLFWQFINSVTSVEESKRFYILFSLLGQTGLYISGELLNILPKLSNSLIYNYELNSSVTVIYIQLAMSVVLILGVAALFIFWLLNHKVLKISDTDIVRLEVKKSKLSLKESIKMIVASRYIRLIATLLFCYGFTINLVEAPWKSKVANLYKTPEDYAAFVGMYLRYTGIFTILFVLLGSNIVRKIGWYYAAIITPVTVFITGLLFFLAINFFGYSDLSLGGWFFFDPLTFAVTMGAIQNVLSKSSKYTLFDSTKEMSYVPLEPELKTKGKAAADLIGIKLGKSSSAFLQSMVFIIFPFTSYSSLSNYLMIIFVVICVLWVWAVRQLSNEYKAISSLEK